MKKIFSLAALSVILLTLAGCNNNTPIIENNSNNSTSSSSEQINTSSSEENSTSSQETSTNAPTVDERLLKGEELISLIQLPSADKIDLTNAVAHYTKGDIIEEISIDNISNEFLWDIKCDYGYIAAVPEDGKDYDYKKYRVDDTIGDFTITEIYTLFSNNEYETLKYFTGTKAAFKGEATLTGEISILEDFVLGEIKFYPDEESKKKLPVVDFRMKSDNSDYDLLITLGSKSQYPNIDFSNIPTDGTRVKAEIAIADYGYRAIYGLPFIGSAAIVDLY